MEIEIVLEKHERRIDELEHEMAGLKAVQNEIRTMNETLCVLTNEIKHTNLHLERHERKLDEMEAQPSKRLHQIVTSLISSICGALITTVIALCSADQVVHGGDIRLFYIIRRCVLSLPPAVRWGRYRCRFPECRSDGLPERLQCRLCSDTMAESVLCRKSAVNCSEESD